MLGWFAETTLVAAALAAVAALVGRARPIGPTARHILWLAVLVKLLTPPLVTWPWASALRDMAWPSVWHVAEAVEEPAAVEPAAVDIVADNDAPLMPDPRPAAIEAVEPVVLPAPADLTPVPFPSPARPAQSGMDGGRPGAGPARRVARRDRRAGRRTGVAHRAVPPPAPARRTGPG